MTASRRPGQASPKDPARGATGAGGRGEARSSGRSPARRRSGAATTPPGESPIGLRLRLPADRLRWSVRPSDLDFATTADLRPEDGFSQQERPLEALRLGAELDSPGYNVFCVGLMGEGRLQVLQEALGRVGGRRGVASDRCYVHDFRRPEAPRLLVLPAGTARQFGRDVDDLIEQLGKHLALVFEEERVVQRIRTVTAEHERAERDLLAGLREQARASGFTVSQVDSTEGAGIDLLYRVGPQLLAIDELDRLAHEVRAGAVADLDEDPETARQVAEELAEVDVAAVRATYSHLAEELRRVMIEARRLARNARRAVADIEREESLVIVEGAIEELVARNQGVADVRQHLDEMKADILDHLALFKQRPASEEPPSSEETGGPWDPGTWEDLGERYRVNVLVDATQRDEQPIVVETIPSLRNLFGTIQRRSARHGGQQADHRTIRGGSLLAADGGWLVIDAADVLAEPDTWRALKRVLLSRRLDLRETASERDQGDASGLRPEPIPVDVKVVMVGDHETYEYLHSMDPDFQHAFKIRAEFDWLMTRTIDNVRRLGRSVRKLTDEEGRRPFSSEAVTALSEHAARLAEDGTKLVSAFDVLADLVRQADVAAGRDGVDVVERAQVEAALLAAERRCSLMAERHREAIHQRKILISTTGTQVGEVNALAVRSTIEHSFGYPVRITAVVSHGMFGVVNIEREVKMSGHLHDKGMFIVQGYLSGKYGHAVPLNFSASVAFEQLYGGIEGDSASSAEIYALLSALSRVPLRQGVAVTGSVNQVGEIQPVSGVDEKVEGFYDACVGLAGGHERLPGDQGVLIPRANASDLMLRPDVVAAAREGRFHVWAIDDIDEGLELLTGWPAGTPDPQGRYPRGSIHLAVMDRLEHFARMGPPPEPHVARGPEDE